MNTIAFIDTEIESGSGKILDMGGIKGNNSFFHSDSIADYSAFLQDVDYICGHNLLNHDLKYLKGFMNPSLIHHLQYIDTLYLSPLLFPSSPYHALLKDDKLQTDALNNPLNDSIKARDLFYDEVSAFQCIDDSMKRILYSLLGDKEEFRSFFQWIGYRQEEKNLGELIFRTFHSLICEEADLDRIISENPIELAYCLALINTRSRYSITPPWVLKNFPDVEKVMFLLRGKPCLKGCAYCSKYLDIHRGLRIYFGFQSYRTYGGEPLQEKAVQAAVGNQSLLAVFPTGGGKSITFQVPALISGYSVKGLTVVISPLQSLMKDQVDNLEKSGITEAVAINGLLDPIERAKSFERVENGTASLLYISPESLRSKTIERLLLGRNVTRFVIDEAHCFSAWGQDFRVDYLYIGDFIKMLQEKKNLEEPIPVSCFTATAKLKVIEDICAYFKEKLSLDLEVFRSNASRSNLHYRVFEKASEEEKYYTLRDLITARNCPTIIYVSRTHKAYSLAQRLTADGYSARPYHGKMDKKEKSENQDAFIRGDVGIMVATSAFGMGVDKKDVGMVIHYEISDSLENYVQEAGRAGRDERISADCYVLYNDEDLNKHFVLLNQSKLSIQEIQQVWKAIKDLTRIRTRVSQSALEIARKAGWDDNIEEVETRVKTAIAALENAGYVKRGQDMPRVFADSILTRNAKEAIGRINDSWRFDEKQKEDAKRIIKTLIASKSRSEADSEMAESRVDYISDRLGIEREDVIQAVNLLREEKILADAKDLTAFIRRRENKNRSLNILKVYWQIESCLLSALDNEEITLNLKELNEQLENESCSETTVNKIRTVITYWAIKGWVKRYIHEYSKNHVSILCLSDPEALKSKFIKRQELAQFIIEYLFAKANENKDDDDEVKEEIPVEFSVYELKEAYAGRLTLFNNQTTMKEVEDALYYLSKIEALKLEGGFFVVYRALRIERLELDNRIKYKQEDYQQLNQYYRNKVQQVHIVGEYARKMISDYKDALQFVDDYFRLNYSSFLNKYFKGSRGDEIQRNITPDKFRQLFGELSPIQLKIINDNVSKYIVVAAGPGSGKTRILVHKLASLLLMEDVKHEQLLMVTFSRAAASEFKNRLQKLIGGAANYIDIKTFHSYCFDLLGKVGTLEKSDEIITETIRRIRNGEVEESKITKTVLVIDEAQDMDAEEFQLIHALMEQNEEMRVIAVGDDDQSIYEFRGASAKYMEQMIREKEAATYEMLENYRSKRNLVDFTNRVVRKISHRLKTTPIHAVCGDLGRIKWVRHNSRNLIIPVVDEILSEGLAGTCCVLTKTNDEALQITGLLVKNGIRTKLIQSNDGFDLDRLLEIRFFIDRLSLSEDTCTIDDQIWKDAKRMFAHKFKGSANFDICRNMISSFERTNPKSKYKSDFELFVRESKWEDFYGEEQETIYVSTIHKAKGREFDTVFMMLDQFDDTTDESLRLLYVGMTRAKNYLCIHSNRNDFRFTNIAGMEAVADMQSYQPPSQLAMQLSYQDVWLDSFYQHQDLISRLNSGDGIIINRNCCFNTNGEMIMRFSKHFMKKMEDMKQRGYEPKDGKINFIFYWRKEGTEQEIKIVLPEVYFEKQSANHFSAGK